jgi:hypothetical protein
MEGRTFMYIPWHEVRVNDALYHGEKIISGKVEKNLSGDVISVAFTTDANMTHYTSEPDAVIGIWR